MNRRTVLMTSLTLTCFFCYLLSLFLPLITVSKFYLANNTLSIMSGVTQLWLDRQIILFTLIFALTVLLPLAKFALLLLFTISQRPSCIQVKILSWLHKLSKWSMLDVFVIALLVVTVKLNIIATVYIHIGLYVFMLSVVALMVLTHVTASKSSEVI